MNRLGVIKTGFKTGDKLTNTEYFVIPDNVKTFLEEEQPKSLYLVFNDLWTKEFIYQRARRKYSKKTKKAVCIGYNHYWLSDRPFNNDQREQLKDLFNKQFSLDEFKKSIKDFDEKQQTYLISQLKNCRGVNFEKKDWEDKVCNESCEYRDSCKENLLFNFNLLNPKTGEIFDRFWLDYLQLQTPSVITMNNTEKLIDRIFKIDGNLGNVTLELFKTKMKNKKTGYNVNVVDIKIVR